MEKKLYGKHKKKMLRDTPYKAAAVRPLTPPSRQLSKLDVPDMQDTAGGVGTSS